MDEGLKKRDLEVFFGLLGTPELEAAARELKGGRIKAGNYNTCLIGALSERAVSGRAGLVAWVEKLARKHGKDQGLLLAVASRLVRACDDGEEVYPTLLPGVTRADYEKSYPLAYLLKQEDALAAIRAELRRRGAPACGNPKTGGGRP